MVCEFLAQINMFDLIHIVTRQPVHNEQNVEYTQSCTHEPCLCLYNRLTAKHDVIGQTCVYMRACDTSVTYMY